MTLVLLAIGVCVLVGAHFLTGLALGRLAPQIPGYDNDEGREAWRAFGLNWGPTTFIYFMLARVGVIERSGRR